MKNIILLHGALGSAGDLAALAQSLKSPERTIHTFSFSGHGKTPFNPAFGIEQFAAELEQFIQEKNLAPAFIFGYSMGGYVAMQLASNQKDLVAKIITLGTKFNWSKEVVEKETRMLNPETLLEKVPAFAGVLEAKHGDSWKELLTRTAALMREIGEKDFLDADKLKTLNTPLLIGLADKDQMVTLDETTRVFKALPNAAMYMLPQTKHQLESVNVSLLSRLICDFIAVE